MMKTPDSQNGPNNLGAPATTFKLVYPAPRSDSSGHLVNPNAFSDATPPTSTNMPSMRGTK